MLQRNKVEIPQTTPQPARSNGLEVGEKVTRVDPQTVCSVELEIQSKIKEEMRLTKKGT